MEVKSSIAFLPAALRLFLSFLSLFPLLFFLTCSAVAAVSKGEQLIESIEAKRKLTATGWLVLLFCLETNAAITSLQKGGGGFPSALTQLLCVFYTLLPLFSLFSLSLIAEVALSAD